MSVPRHHHRMRSQRRVLQRSTKKYSGYGVLENGVTECDGGWELAAGGFGSFRRPSSSYYFHVFLASESGKVLRADFLVEGWWNPGARRGGKSPPEHHARSCSTH